MDLSATTIILLLLAGVGGGFLGGLLGVGGGIIFILALPDALLLAGVPKAELAQFVIANSLFAAVFSSLSASATLFKNKMWFPKPVLTIAGVAVFISYLVLQFVVNTPYYSVFWFNITVITLLSYMVFRLLSGQKGRADLQPVHDHPTVKLGSIGLLSGVVAPMTGLGGGVVIIPILNAVFKYPIKQANAISIGAIGITSLSSSIVNMLSSPQTQLGSSQLGYIYLPIVFPLIVGVLVGSPFGVITSKKASPLLISRLFGVFISLTILKKLIELL